MAKSTSECMQPPMSHVDGSLIYVRFVHEYDEEYDQVKKARRPGRPASTREDLLKMKIAALTKEQTDGFCKGPPSA